MYVRNHCEDNYDTMMEDIPTSLIGDNMVRDGENLIHKYCRRARDYIAVYHQGHAGGEAVEEFKKEYASHRRPSPNACNEEATKKKPWEKKRALLASTGERIRTALGVRRVVAILNTDRRDDVEPVEGEREEQDMEEDEELDDDYEVADFDAAWDALEEED